MKVFSFCHSIVIKWSFNCTSIVLQLYFHLYVPKSATRNPNRAKRARRSQIRNPNRAKRARRSQIRNPKLFHLPFIKPRRKILIQLNLDLNCGSLNRFKNQRIPAILCYLIWIYFFHSSPDISIKIKDLP
jgi:hypothetical protein